MLYYDYNGHNESQLFPQGRRDSCSDISTASLNIRYAKLLFMANGELSLTTAAVPFERLNVNDTALLIVDHQVGLINMVGDWDKTVFRNNILGHSALGKLFNIPVVMTSSFQQGISSFQESIPKSILTGLLRLEWTTYEGNNGHVS